MDCNNSDEKIKNNPFHIDYDNCKLSIDLTLSDLIEDCKLIPLETTPESILGRFIRIINISGDYIIIADGNNVYKFSKDGKFINIILKKGRGPGEISGSCRYFYEKNKNLLFIEDDFVENDYLRCYDINSETFLPSIKKCFQGRWIDFIVYQDSLIMGSVEGLQRGETNPYALFIQNFEGRFIQGIKSNRTFSIPRNDGNDNVLQRFIISEGDKSLHVKYQYDDTLFTLKDNNLSFYLIPEYRNKNRQPNIMGTEGDRNTSYDSYENPTFMILEYSVFKGYIPRAHYTMDYFILNKSNSKYSLIQSYYDDFTGKKFHLGRAVPFTPGVDKEFPAPNSSPDGLLYVIYYPFELPEIALEGKDNSFKPLLIPFKKIKSNLKETDNPILLIGHPKKNLRVLN